MLLVNIFHAVISKYTKGSLSTYVYISLLNILLKEAIILKPCDGVIRLRARRSEIQNFFTIFHYNAKWKDEKYFCLRNVQIFILSRRKKNPLTGGQVELYYLSEK